MTKKVSVVMPIYEPEILVLERARKMLRKQTIPNILIENWNMPEAKSMNKGIKMAKTEIVVTLDQDCVPENKYWLERLIKPLENKGVVVSVSDLYIPKWYWKEYPFYTRILSLKDRVTRRPGMDARGCAYRKKDLIKAGMFDEREEVVSIEHRLTENFKKMGKIVHTGCRIGHLHHMDNNKKITLDYNYSLSNGQNLRKGNYKGGMFFRKLVTGIPLIGIIPIIGIYPLKRFPFYFPFYLLFSPIQHSIILYGFWRGFFGSISRRNKV